MSIYRIRHRADGSNSDTLSPVMKYDYSNAPHSCYIDIRTQYCSLSDILALSHKLKLIALQMKKNQKKENQRIRAELGATEGSIVLGADFDLPRHSPGIVVPAMLRGSGVIDQRASSDASSW